MSLVNKRAPDFEAKAIVNGKIENIKLSDYLGKWIILLFYSADFSPLCPLELKEFANKYEELERLNAEIIAGSVDGIWSHKVFIEKELPQIKYPVFSDSAGQISKKFGVLLEDAGVALRATFIIDTDGVVQYEVVHNTGIGRSVDETLRVLQALQSGGVCPPDWKPGEPTLII
ncbi:MAG TPA: peroxiredoxin [bacterium (Candidatus Stahlbacteria)]|nr:peroxiredoxin [Candidatus Stahlbacteria bacterium]